MYEHYKTPVRIQRYTSARDRVDTDNFLLEYFSFLYGRLKRGRGLFKQS